VTGALTMMRHDAAAAAVSRCANEIKRFADPGYAAHEADFEGVANQLSMIGFFIDSLQYGAVDFASFARQIESPSLPAAADADAAESEAPQVSVEQEVAQHQRATHEMLAALREHPADARLRQDLKQTLTVLKNDADLLADKALGEQAKAVIAALESGEQGSAQVDRALEILVPRAPEATPPTTAGVLVATASVIAGAKADTKAEVTGTDAEAEVDAELLGIFLEEAHEVLATIAESLRQLREQPHDAASLTTVRRSFHTLKGSGRMVGLKDLGDAAWSLEQTLNLWLRQELAAAEPLCELLDQAHALFSTWVAQLASGSGQTPDPAAVVARSEALRAGADERQVGSLPPAAPTRAGAPVAESTFADSELTFDESALAAPATVLPESAVEERIAADAASGHASVPADKPPVAAPKISDAADAADAAPTVARPAEPVAVETTAQPKLTLSPLLFEIFFDEARTHFTTLDRELGLLERHESSPTPHEMYRAAHTLAGISATVGLDAVNRLGLALEHALRRRDHSTHPASLEALGVVRQAVGELELALASLADKRAPVIAQGLVESLDAIYASPAEDFMAPEPGAPTEVPAAAVPGGLAIDTLVGNILEPAAAIDAQNETAAGLEKPPAGARQLHDEIDEQLLPIFLEEAVELNREIADRLRAWRHAPNDRDIVRTLTRLLHTLKGSARMAGAMNLGELTHSMETRLDQASHAGEVSLETIDEIQNDQDAVLQYVDALQQREPVARTAERHAEAPVVAEKRKDPLRVAGGELFDADADGVVQTATLRVRAELIDRLVNDAGELSISRSRIEGEMRSLKESLLDLTENVIRLRRQLREIEIQAESQLQSRTAQADAREGEFDPLELDRFTRFQELTRMMAESVNDVGTVQQNLLKNLDDANAAIVAQARLNREVQQELMAVRMIPFGSLADRLYRIVRQTSKELNKRVNLEISGSQVELDRSVLDKIGAPLEHMLRNAIAHGIEEREVRRARGKPE
ncbi:MAG: Hpt domain-containing protein, partial [Propionivibrio sp.]